MKISQLMAAQVLRNDTAFAESCKGWTLSDFSNAMCGEAGEVANEVKKFRRGDYNKRQTEFQEKLGKEIADVFAYGLILANKAGLSASSLEGLICDKFNEVSKKVGSEISLFPDGTIQLHGVPVESIIGAAVVSVPEGDSIHPKPEGARVTCPMPGLLVRYDAGSSALGRLVKTHAGGWYLDQCMGGSTFASGPFFLPTEADKKTWEDCAHWRRPVSR